MKVLGIGVNRDKVDALNFGVNHVIDGIFAGPAYSQDLDSGERFYLWFNLWHALKLNFRCAYLIRESEKEKQLTNIEKCYGKN